MESQLNQTREDKDSILESLDFLFVPSSITRWTHREVRKGVYDYNHKTGEKLSELAKRLPYAMSLVIEGLRSYGYYKLGEQIFS